MENSSGQHKSVKNTLDMSLVIKIYRWLEHRCKNTDWANVALDKVVDEISEELKITVRPRQLKSIISKSGIPMPTRSRARASAVAVNGGAKNRTAARLRALRMAIVNLLEELGKPIPENLNWSDAAGSQV